MDGFLQPIMEMVDKLGIKKTAADNTQGNAPDLTNDQLAKELGKLAGDMPEELAGQKMHDEKTPMDNPESPPADRKLEQGMDSAYSPQKRIDDNLDNLSQTSAPLSDPSDLDTDQDPLARMAAKIACAIEPKLKEASDDLEQSAGRLSRQIAKQASPIKQVTEWATKHPAQSAAGLLAGGAALGGGLGFFGGKKYERAKDAEEDTAIFNLGANIGGQMAANEILSQLQAAQQTAPPGAEKDKKKEG